MKLLLLADYQKASDRMKLGFKKLASIMALSVILTGCTANLTEQVERQSEPNPGEVAVQTTNNQISDDYYRAVITDGKYRLAASASADSFLTASGDVEAFEEGLLRISKQVFPTNQYYIQEGQLIDADTMTSWLSRESEENPEGLNPELPSAIEEEVTEENAEESVAPEDEPENPEEQAESEESTPVVENTTVPPIYLAQIMEQNMMVETDDGFALAGVVIGLAMNSTYEYTDSQGVIYKQDISMGEMRERGRQYANIIVGRLRNTPQLRSVPILVGIYSSAPADSTVGGTYILDGISREGNSVSDWKEHNEYRVALPSPTNQQGDAYVYFDNFKNAVQNFFPNLNGISGEALHINDALASLDIEVVTQFYQKTEIIALTQHITDMAQQHLPEGMPIKIKVISTIGAESFIHRPSGSTQFSSQILN